MLATINKTLQQLKTILATIFPRLLHTQSMQQNGSFTARRRAQIRSFERPRGRGQLRAVHSINTACYLVSQLCSERILDVTFVSRD